jgi:hypothetical protein
MAEALPFASLRVADARLSHAIQPLQLRVLPDAVVTNINASRISYGLQHVSDAICIYEIVPWL